MAVMPSLSKETRIKIFIGIDLAFFLLEIIIGYTAHSLALVADAFHMLNDVISLCVGLWAVRVATQRSSTSEYTYGWLRAEIIGGLVNGVFLVALCLSIILDAIQRFFEPQEVKQPKLVLVVGGVGLLFNILGLFIFHQPHDHGHSHDEEEGVEDDHHIHIHADESSAHTHDHSSHSHEEHSHAKEATASGKKKPDELLKSPALAPGRGSIQWADAGKSPRTPKTPLTAASDRRASATSRRNSRSLRPRSRSSIQDMPEHPYFLREEMKARGRGEGAEPDEDYSDEDEGLNEVDTNNSGQGQPTEVTPLIQKSGSSTSHSSHKQGGATTYTNGNVTHAHHTHAQPKEKGKEGGHGHGHSHADMNIRGMFLHVLGDALGNVGVMATALIIWLSPWPWRFYFDPIISLFITLIILKTAIPLCRETVKPLLQAVPSHISVDDITDDIESLPGVRSCHDVHVWALTPSKLVATLDVELDIDFAGQNATEYMEIAREIKSCLHGHGIHSSTIQAEFCTHATHEVDFEPSRAAHSSSLASTAGASAMATGGDAAACIQEGCGTGACLLDCNGSCKTGKQCCGPNKSGEAGSPKSTDGSGNGKHSHR